MKLLQFILLTALTSTLACGKASEIKKTSFPEQDRVNNEIAQNQAKNANETLGSDDAKNENANASASTHTPPKVLCTNCGDIVVHITNLRNTDGQVSLFFFNTKDGYENNVAVARYAVPIENGEANTVIKNFPYGEYGIYYFHDENANWTNDRNFYGMPKEGVGSSNNAGKFGRPSYDDIKFQFSSPSMDMNMKIRYLF